MAELAYWDDSDGLWDRLKLGPHHMPGAWEVTCECERELDVKKSKGQDGAHIKDHGYVPGSVQLRGRFLSKDEWTEMQKLLPELHPRKKGGERHPLAVEHPALSVMGITTVYVFKIHSPRIVDNGLLELEIECIEWTPPKKAKTSTKPSKYAPTKWSAEQLAANARAAGTGFNGPAFLETRQGAAQPFSPGEIAAANANEIEDKRRAKEIADLLKK